MQDLLFYSLYIAPFVILALYRDRNGFHVLKVTCANALMLFYLVCNHVGLLWMYLHPAGVKQLTIVNRETVVLLAFYSLVVVAAYVITGNVLGSKYTAVRVPKIDALRREKIHRVAIVIVLLVATPIAIATFLDNSALMILLSGDAVGANIARVETVSNAVWFLGIKLSYLKIIFVVLWYGSALSLVFLMSRKKIRDFLLYIAIFFVGGLASFTNLSKGIIISELYPILFIYSLIYARGYLINKAFWCSMIYVLCFVGIFSAWVMGNESIYFLYPFERLTLGNLVPQYVVVDSFGFDNLLYGTTTPWWYSFGLHKQFLLDVFVWRQLMGGNEDFFYTAPSSFVAEAHANFHVIGVVLISFFVFFVLRTIDFLIKKIRSENIFTALMVCSALYFSGMSIKGMASYLIDYYYWSLLLFALFFYRIRFHFYRTPKPEPRRNTR